MQKTVFDFKDYRSYLNWQISSKPGRGWGLKSSMAKASGCQASFVSRVLRGGAHFSSEQLDALGEMLGLTNEDSRFLLLLLQHERAGTRSLRAKYETQISEALERRTNIKSHLKIKESISSEARATYYSLWYYSAIHILVSIKAYQGRDTLSRYLALPIQVVSEALKFLETAGLVAREPSGQYTVGLARIHLGKESPHAYRHHANWRIRAIQSIEKGLKEDVHYSVVVGVSDADADKIRRKMIDFIREIVEIVDASEQEGGHCFTMDFFKI